MVKFRSKYKKTDAQQDQIIAAETDPANFPAGRRLSEPVSPGEPVLTSNMNGQVTLAGSPFNLQFSRGHLKKISFENSTDSIKIESRTYLQSSLKKIDYRNESAFALDTDSDYGLRSVQICKKTDCIRRIITDFFFNRVSDECFIACCVDYPVFEPEDTVTASAPLELSIRIGETDPEIHTPDSTVTVRQNFRSEAVTIPGSSFEIHAGKHIQTIEFIREYGTRRFVSVDRLEARITTKHGARHLQFYPGGSRKAAPAGFYSGLTEQFCFKLGIKPRK